MEARQLTPDEAAVYSRLAEVLLPSEAAIVREQLAVATICDDADDQHWMFHFNINRPVRKLHDDQSQTMTGSYDDRDGWPIDIIVHAAAGLLSYVERYRTDAGPIKETRWPLPSQIRLEPSKESLSRLRRSRP